MLVVVVALLDAEVGPPWPQPLRTTSDSKVAPNNHTVEDRGSDLGPPPTLQSLWDARVARRPHDRRRQAPIGCLERASPDLPRHPEL